MIERKHLLDQRTSFFCMMLISAVEEQKIIQNVLNTTNPFATSYRHLHEVEQMERAKCIFMKNVKTLRRKNKLIHQEVAAIFTGKDGAPPKRTFVVNCRGDGKLSYLSDISPVVDPLCYPLLFPNGDLGYWVDILHFGRSNSGKESSNLTRIL